MKVIYDGSKPVGVFEKGVYRNLMSGECILFMNGEPVGIATIDIPKGIIIEGNLEVTDEVREFMKSVLSDTHG